MFIYHKVWLKKRYRVRELNRPMMRETQFNSDRQLFAKSSKI
jgi:hypothetical protein